MNGDLRDFVGSVRPFARGRANEAAEWLALREFGLSAEKKREFEKWLDADERNLRALRKIESAWEAIRRSSRLGASSALEMEVELLVEARRRHRRRKVVGLSMAGVAAAAVLFGFVSTHRSRQVLVPSNSATVRIRPESRVLSDGSIIELNAGADLAVNFTAKERNVRLLRGEAHFKVEKNATRPFVVTAGAVAVRAVGTEFDVCMAPRWVDVLVTEGKVAVRTVGPSAIGASHVAAEPIFVTAGSRLKLPDGENPSAPPQVESIDESEIVRATTWRSMRVEFTGTPLSEVVGMFNRQNEIQLAVRDGPTGLIQISGIFWADDPEGFSRLVEASAGLRVSRESSNRIVFSRP